MMTVGPILYTEVVKLELHNSGKIKNTHCFGKKIYQFQIIYDYLISDL